MQLPRVDIFLPKAALPEVTHRKAQLNLGNLEEMGGWGVEFKGTPGRLQK